jgi:hypothetical protein
MSKIIIEPHIVDRFWGYVDKSGGCWNWKAGLFTNGYGQFRVGKKKMKAHRVAYLINGGEIPEGKILCHKCDNPKCVNPSHLTLADHKFNAQDRVAKGRSAINRMNGKPGELNPSAKLKESQVLEIIKLRKEGCAAKQLAKKFSVSISLIYTIARGKLWQQIQG